MTGVFNVKKSAIWHAIAPIYDATTVIITDMLPCTAQIRYHCQAHQHATEVTPPTGVIDPPLGIIATPDILTMITRIDQGLLIPNPTHITIDIGVAAIMTPIGATPRSFHRPSQCSFSCHRSSSSYRYCRDTLHHRSSSHRNLSQDDSRSQHKS